jgi:hypothetical protein
MNFKFIPGLVLVLSDWFGIAAVAFGGPPLGPGPTLPGVSKGQIETYWLAPYVWVSAGFGGTTVTWFAEDGHVKRQMPVSGIEPGFVDVIGKGETVQGVNEDWQITLPPEPPPVQSGYSMSGFITSTRDSRVFIHEYHPQPGRIALDIYLHGKLAHTLGPYWQYQASEVELNDDGSASLQVWKDEAHSATQVVTTDANGAVGPETDCGQPGSPAIGPNPRCLGRIPTACKSLFSTSIGFDDRYHLIDWNTGKSLWDIPCPGSEKAQALAVGFTPKLIVFAVAELYKPGPWRGEQWVLDNNGKEWIRAFYAVSVQDGSIVARWQAKYPQRLAGDERDQFIWLGGKFFYVTASEFVELNSDDTMAKKNGWH